MISDEIKSVKKNIYKMRNKKIIKIDLFDENQNSNIDQEYLKLNLKISENLKKSITHTNQILEEINKLSNRINEWQTFELKNNTKYNEYKQSLELRNNKLKFELKMKQKTLELCQRKIQVLKYTIKKYANMKKESLSFCSNIENYFQMLEKYFYQLMANNYGKTLRNVVDDRKESMITCVCFLRRYIFILTVNNSVLHHFF
ncbi:uncharacterized protein LOC126895534 [Daktulosphaira vitifoliae]|uniref:uncharacterized protein LOC126895534 n=1 Tax=Daktulosphaira vitifoliae TaxID=58002 RepID=UPI0021AA0E85|nr:uncharacterized protein LOC126895534 [Daktulosphaira vitifoliae]